VRCATEVCALVNSLAGWESSPLFKSGLAGPRNFFSVSVLLPHPRSLCSDALCFRFQCMHAFSLSVVRSSVSHPPLVVSRGIAKTFVRK